MVLLRSVLVAKMTRNNIQLTSSKFEENSNKYYYSFGKGYLKFLTSRNEKKYEIRRKNLSIQSFISFLSSSDLLRYQYLFFFWTRLRGRIVNIATIVNYITST